mmetsp:Transcript_99058/g.284633  ORF Transcript_99058/g.284633 Transcript_99058/m.284633 type:complete len:230 (+) Transcript_99058:560-1249(+)
MVYKMFVTISKRKRRQSPAAKMHNADMSALAAGRASVGTSTKAWAQIEIMNAVCHMGRVRGTTMVFGKRPLTNTVASPRKVLAPNSGGIMAPWTISEPTTMHKHTPAIQPALAITLAVATFHEASSSASCLRSKLLTSSSSLSLLPVQQRLGSNSRNQQPAPRVPNCMATRMNVPKSMMTMVTPRGLATSQPGMAPTIGRAVGSTRVCSLGAVTPRHDTSHALGRPGRA